MIRLRAGTALAALALVTLAALLIGLSRTSALPFNPTFEASVSNSAAGVNADLSLRTVLADGEHLPFVARFSFPAGSFDFAADGDIKPNGQTVGSGTLTIDLDCDDDDDTFPFTIEEVKSDNVTKTEYKIVGLPAWGPQTLLLNGDLGSGHTIDLLMFFDVGGPPCLQTPLDLTFTLDGLSSGDSDVVVTNPSSAGSYTLSAFYDPNPSIHAEAGSECANADDDDSDGIVNDGCPTVGATDENPQCANAINDDSGDDSDVNDGCPKSGPPESICTGDTDEDSDGFVNDGCPQVGATSEDQGQCANAANDDSGDDSVVNDGCPLVFSTLFNIDDEVCIVNCTTPTPTPTPSPLPTPTPTPTTTPTPTSTPTVCPDFNEDGAVNGRDTFLIAIRFGSTTLFTPTGRLPYLALYDLNADNAINIQDVFIFALDFNTTCL